MTEFISRRFGNEEFEVIIKTTDSEHYNAAIGFARKLIDHEKPMVPGHENLHDIAEMAYNNGYAKGLEEGRGKWIPASEPPKEWRDEEGNAINYLAYIPETGVDIANWIGPANCWMCFGIPCVVTHWMPLPEGPNVKP